jgi:hypothetical protein
MPEQRHESQEPSLRGLTVASLVLAGAIVVAVGVCLGLVALFGGFQRPLARAEHHPMPEPRLQPHPLSDRARYDERQRAKLTRYVWVDRGGGIVRIPVARAMRILTEQQGPPPVHGGSGSAQKPGKRRSP